MNSMQNRNRSAVRRHKGTCIAASAISDVFSPLLMATYAMAVALWLTPMAYLPLGVRAWSTVGVFFITAVIPASTVFVLMKMGRVSDASISDRRERPLPFIVAVLCYCGAWLYLSALNAPRWMLCFMAAAAAVALMELLISFFWKISAHTGAAAGLAALVFWLASRGALRIDELRGRVGNRSRPRRRGMGTPLAEATHPRTGTRRCRRRFSHRISDST